jgi:hypothetical protein
MIGLLGASAIMLAGLQASITAPTEAFRGCLREAVSKASSEKVAGNAIEAYLRGACSGQMSTLKSAVISFRMKNGMARKAAGEDADMTVEDYIATPSDNYKYLAEMKAGKSNPATPVATPASAPSQPPKP